MNGKSDGLIPTVPILFVLLSIIVILLKKNFQMVLNIVFLNIVNIVCRSLIYILTAYVYIGMNISFSYHWTSILFMMALIWYTADYQRSISRLIGNKVLSILLCAGCLAICTLIALLVGYIQGNVVPF